ncbi:hypothetical protein E4T50_08000 [Aureobasidium sp. EXF-12298]|nr:hypothetical protein E4T50_08000 [Aureobasidium sp. EXF-12298]
MCGTETSRPVLGGTIAILKSLGESTLPDLSLLFHQTEASTTTATFQSTSVSETTTDAELASCQIVILSDDIDITRFPIVDVYDRVVQLAEEAGSGGWRGRDYWEKSGVGETDPAGEARHHRVELRIMEEETRRDNAWWEMAFWVLVEMFQLRGPVGVYQGGIFSDFLRNTLGRSNYLVSMKTFILFSHDPLVCSIRFVVSQGRQHGNVEFPQLIILGNHHCGVISRRGIVLPHIDISELPQLACIQVLPSCISKTPIQHLILTR